MSDVEEKERNPLCIYLSGDLGVGKTSLLNVLFGHEYDIAVFKGDWAMVRMTVNYNGVDWPIILKDTGGCERFGFYTPGFYIGVNAIYYVFAVNDRESFDHLERWMEDANDNSRVLQGPVQHFIIGNKIDLEDRVVSREEAEAFAESRKMKYIETSAKEKKNVGEIINLLLAPRVKGGNRNDNHGGKKCILQ